MPVSANAKCESHALRCKKTSPETFPLDGYHAKNSQKRFILARFSCTEHSQN